MTSPTAAAPGEELLARLGASPDVYPQKIDLVRELVLLVQLDAAGYRAASFLDDRILGPGMKGGWVPLARLTDSPAQVRNPRPLHFIFHTGHVGSTLVSRLLDETGGVLSLREPLPLRALAEAHDALAQPESLLSQERFELLRGALIKLWSRGYDSTRAVVLKATSSTGRIASRLLAADGSSRALCLNLRAEPYLATLLAGQNSPVDLRGHGPVRIRGLQARVGAPLAPLHALSLGELAAMSWLADSWAQHEARSRFPDRVMACDFDEFLADVPGAMAAILGHFDLPRDERFLAAVGSSPVLTRYSKAVEHAYSPGFRLEVLDDSRRRNAAEIRYGLSWLERLAQTEPVVAQLLGEP